MTAEQKTIAARVVERTNLLSSVCLLLFQQPETTVSVQNILQKNLEGSARSENSS